MNSGVATRVWIYSRSRSCRRQFRSENCESIVDGSSRCAREVVMIGASTGWLVVELCSSKRSTIVAAHS